MHLIRFEGQNVRIGDNVLLHIKHVNLLRKEITFQIEAPESIRVHQAERYHIEKVNELKKYYRSETCELLNKIAKLENKLSSTSMLSQVHALLPTTQVLAKSKNHKPKRFSLKARYLNEESKL